VAQDAVGFDNIDRASANQHKIPFSNTADVLTDATAEFAFFLMGCVARKTWPSEQMVREQTWSTWHPHQPWLGDEVTGRTVAVIGTGRIGKSFIKKAVGFDMDVLCHDPAFEDAKFVESVRRVMELRHKEGFVKRLQTIRYAGLRRVPARGRLRDAAREPHASRRGGEPDLSPDGRGPLQADEADRVPDQHRARPRRQRAGARAGAARGRDRGRGARRLREGAAAGGEPAARRAAEAEAADVPSLRLGGPRHAAVADPDVGMAGRVVQAVIDVLEKRHGGDPKQMPYVVNKEAF
jgi:glyoxylate reductase